MKQILFNTLVLAAGLTACSSLSHKKDEDALKSVKKIAVVALTVDEPASATIGVNLGSGKTQAGRGGSMIPQHSEAVNQMLVELQNDFGKNTGWRSLDLQTITANPGYASAYHKTMDGWQSKSPPNAGRNRFLVDHVMDNDCLRILAQPGRDKLIQDLGVDAIVTAYVNVFLNGTSVMGIGSRHPQSNLSFALYIKGREDPVWFEGQIKGEEAAESVGSTGFTDENATSRLALASAKTAFAKINKAAE